MTCVLLMISCIGCSEIGEGFVKHPSLLARACGMGLFLAWIVGFAFINEISESQLVKHGPEIEKYVPIVANIITLLVLTANHRQLCGLAKRRGILFLTGTCAVLAPVIAVISLRLLGSLALFSFGMVLRGIAAATLFMEWNELFARLSVTVCGGMSFRSVCRLCDSADVDGRCSERACFCNRDTLRFGSRLSCCRFRGRIRHPVPSDDLEEGRETAWTFPRPV